MKESKKRLTLLKSRVTDHIPEGDDVFGYEGISRAMLLAVVDEAYNILNLLDTFPPSFETIFLERAIAAQFERGNKQLKNDFQKNPEEFNAFLNTIHRILVQAKETYILLAREPIRTDIEVTAAKNALIALQEQVAEIQPLHAELVDIKTQSTELIESLETKNTLAFENEEKITTILEEIDSLKEDAEKAAKQIPAWEENIKATKEDLAARSLEYVELNKKIELLKTTNEETDAKNTVLANKLAEQLKQNAEFQEAIRDTIGNANRHGMAGSFKTRKDELSRSLLLWGILTLASIITLIFMSYYTLIAITDKTIDLTHILARLPVFGSCVWLGWFCAKQYGFTSRVMEDYSYKYAVSMAFEGYNDASSDIDEKLQQKLLAMTIENISNSPLHIFDSKNNHAHPLEAINGFGKGLKGKAKGKGIEVDVALTGEREEK